jgi:hypothetical protein
VRFSCTRVPKAVSRAGKLKLQYDCHDWPAKMYQARLSILAWF